VADSPKRDPQVLIVGAGPTGLVLAVWLAHLGVRLRIVDKAPEPATTSRAIAVQARTLELYQQVGLADAVVRRGRQVSAVDVWVAGRQTGRAYFGAMDEGISPYPYTLVFSQDEHERLLVDRLREAGVEVERGTELVTCAQEGDEVHARIRRSDGTVERCAARYVAGCDGAHSAVREALSIGFPGGTYEHLFYVADVDAGGPVLNGHVHVALDRSDFLAVFPLRGDGRARLVGTLRDRQSRDDSLSWDDVSRQVLEWVPIDVRRVNWFSTYRVHHRVAERFRDDGTFLLGDAAHIHSPVGGQGMNTGIGDAVNLAWKLAAVLDGGADPAILRSYETERIAFARRLVATTDRAFTAVTSSGVVARTLRLHVVPSLISFAFASRSVRRFMFRTVSQTSVNYRGSQMSEGRAGDVHGGDRLPWVKIPGHHDDNFAPLRSLGWQVHIYGEPMTEIRAVCEQRRLPLHVFPWHAGMGTIGLERGALYLVRPDGYVALASEHRSAAALRSYLEARGLTRFIRH
jgi:2-polyprenyl-6-methoxyphenol hydroxylase-like FAD-dependent oxidoreductase